jgi:hypothetical protein
MTISKNKEFIADIAKFHDYLMVDLKFLKDKILYGNNLFTLPEKKEILEAFLIKIIAEWDNFLEKSLVYLTKDDTSKLSEYLGLNLPPKINFDTCQAILNGLNYFDIKSSSNLKSIAKKILPDSNNPFQHIESKLYTIVDDLYIIRNYVAHKSKASKRSLTTLYKKKGREEFIEPGYYFMEDENEHNFWVGYMGILIKFSTDIWKNVDSETYEAIFKDAYSSQNALRDALSKMKKYFKDSINGGQHGSMLHNPESKK